jgi:hypothetical protein
MVKVKTSSLQPPALQPFPISATVRQPVCFGDNLRCQLDTPFSNVQAFVINPTFPTDDIQMTARYPGCYGLAFQVD